mgnify:CR=1 FL=1
MNKYDILEGKLTAINAYIDTMCLESNSYNGIFETV